MRRKTKSKGRLRGPCWSNQALDSPPKYCKNSVAATGKKRLLMTHDEAVAVLAALSTYPVLPVTRDLVLAAIDLKQRFVISYWDAAILAAAKTLGCQTVYSEDLNHGQDYDGVRVENPLLTLTSSATP
jgi:predicted nucleic acid-binding protein